MNRFRLVAGIVAVALVAAGFSGWWFLFRDTAPEAVSLEDAVASASTLPGSDGRADGAPTSVEGAWVLASGSDSFVGYRVQEELASIGAKTAAGRTADIEASLAISEGRVDSVTIVADLTTLESDDSRRDGAIRRQALETDTHPIAGFTLTAPIDLPAGASRGDPISVLARGDLDLHGVTRSVEVPLEAQLVEGKIVVVGSLPILFADYEIEKPRSMIVLSVDDNGLMEFQLVFERAG